MKIALDAPSTNAASGTPGPNLAKLRKSGQDFEAMLLGSLWKDMRLGFGEDEQGELGGDGGPLQEVAFQALAGQAVKSKGIGIAKMVVHSLEATARQADSQAQANALPAGQGFLLHPNKVQMPSILPSTWAAQASTPAAVRAFSLRTGTGSGNTGDSSGQATGATAPGKD